VSVGEHSWSLANIAISASISRIVSFQDLQDPTSCPVIEQRRDRPPSNISSQPATSTADPTGRINGRSTHLPRSGLVQQNLSDITTGKGSSEKIHLQRVIFIDILHRFFINILPSRNPARPCSRHRQASRCNLSIKITRGHSRKSWVHFPR
jgi:hypothetical protein